ncbi:MAG: ComEC family competence protein [Endomicrobium sp.]|jgi:competence protein ComEC|nr:ComEC family competence protein [Endomicrobium sp.]
MDWILKLLRKRPVITAFLIYALAIIFADFFGYFSYENQSKLYTFTKNNSIVSIEGKVLSEPHVSKNRKRFLLETYNVNENIIGEKIIVNSPNGYSIHYGDIINIEGKLKRPKSSDSFDYQKYLARNNVYVVCDVYSFEYIESKPNSIKKIALNVSQDISNKFNAYFKKSYADILKSLILGDKSSLTQSVKNDFISSGVMHILVVSGLHVSFISAIILFILKLTGVSLKKAYILSIPIIFFYVIMTGANPPALRAAIMLSCIFLSFALDREPLIYNSLALSALAILIFEPQQLFTASFQMSYGATIGIVHFYKDIFAIFENVESFILRFFCGVLSVTLAVQVVLIPICIYYFSKVSIISFLTNIIVVPLVGIIMSLGVSFYVLTFILKYAAVLVSVILSIILNFVLSITNIMANIKYAVINFEKPTIIELLFYFLFLFCSTNLKCKNRFIFLGVILVANLAYLLIHKS